MTDKLTPPSAARFARLIARGTSFGALATVRKGKNQGHPYVSKVGVALEIDGSPLFLFSTLATHTQDILVDPRASLLVEAPRPDECSNPLQTARATLVGCLERLPPDADEYEKSRYLARHPGAAQYAGFGDFSMWRMSVEKIHYVGGFGLAKWAKAEEYLTPVSGLKENEFQIIADLKAAHKNVIAIDADGVTLAGLEGVVSRQNFKAPAKDIKDWFHRFESLFQN